MEVSVELCNELWDFFEPVKILQENFHLCSV